MFDDYDVAVINDDLSRKENRSLQAFAGVEGDGRFSGGHLAEHRSREEICHDDRRRIGYNHSRDAQPSFMSKSEPNSRASASITKVAAEVAEAAGSEEIPSARA